MRCTHRQTTAAFVVKAAIGNRSRANAATLASVRRILFTFLLALLPFQFSLAAVTSYCRHETGSASKHLGHHQHQHQYRAVAGEVATIPESGVPTGTDNDCGICHLSAAQSILDRTSVALGPPDEPPRFQYGWRYESYISSGPDRPDRAEPTSAVRFGGEVVFGACLPA